jgi:hypothetical protein
MPQPQGVQPVLDAIATLRKELASYPQGSATFEKERTRLEGLLDHIRDELIKACSQHGDVTYRLWKMEGIK